MTWAERIERAERVGEFNNTDRRLVSYFSTCAVGEKLHLQAGFSFSQVPVKLDALGMELSEAIRIDNVSDARRIFDQITAYEVKA